jgi:hypothetical protein
MVNERESEWQFFFKKIFLEKYERSEETHVDRDGIFKVLRSLGTSLCSLAGQ